MKLVIAALALVACVVADQAISIHPILDRRIIGGHVVDISDYNWQVQLLRNNSFHCGGTIIGTTWVVTAAHCSYGKDKSSFGIRAGTNILNSGGVVINVAELYQHPNYNNETKDYDISVLRLASALPLGTNIGIATLPKDNQYIPVGINVTVTGWGRTSVDSSDSVNLLAITVPPRLHQAPRNKVSE